MVRRPSTSTARGFRSNSEQCTAVEARQRAPQAELFIFLMRNALSATAFFQLPAGNTLEIARQVDL